MYTKQEIIIRSYREGKSHRCISREIHVSRHTVKKYIAAYGEALNTSENVQTAASSYLSSSPVYKLNARTKLKLTVELQ